MLMFTYAGAKHDGIHTMYAKYVHVLADDTEHLFKYNYLKV